MKIKGLAKILTEVTLLSIATTQCDLATTDELMREDQFLFSSPEEIREPFTTGEIIIYNADLGTYNWLYPGEYTPKPEIWI